MTSTSQSLVADPGSIEALHRAITARDTDPYQILRARLRRIDEAEPQVQGWCLLDRDGATMQAERLRAEAAAGRLRGPLHGIPVAVKDVIDVAGFPTRAGSRTRAAVAPSVIDAQIVAQLRAAGAVILGKAHTTEFAYFDGPPPTRNPHDLARTPGGSSAGPAAVVAAGMVPMSLATQTAGSISRPAAYCGIAAFKPSTRAWPGFGVVPFSPCFDTVGVFGYRTADATTAARVLMPPFLRARGPRTRRPQLAIGFIDDPILAAAAPPVSDLLRSVAAKLAASGFQIEQCVSPVALAAVTGWHKTITEYELGRAYAHLLAAPEADVAPGLRAAVSRGRDIDDWTYRDACGTLDATGRTFWAALDHLDALAFPAAPAVAPPGTGTGDPRFIIPFTALGGPILSVPAGYSSGLPLGLMLIAAPGDDDALADIGERVAAVIEVPR